LRGSTGATGSPGVGGLGETGWTGFPGPQGVTGNTGKHIVTGYLNPDHNPVLVVSFYTGLKTQRIELRRCPSVRLSDSHHFWIPG